MKILGEETSFLGQNLVTKVFAKKKKREKKEKGGKNVFNQSKIF